MYVTNACRSPNRRPIVAKLGLLDPHAEDHRLDHLRFHPSNIVAFVLTLLSLYDRSSFNHSSHGTNNPPLVTNAL